MTVYISILLGIILVVLIKIDCDIGGGNNA